MGGIVTADIGVVATIMGLAAFLPLVLLGVTVCFLWKRYRRYRLARHVTGPPELARPLVVSTNSGRR